MLAGNLVDAGCFIQSCLISADCAFDLATMMVHSAWEA